MGEQGAEASQAGEAYLEARFGDVVAPLCQQGLRPLYAQAGQELVRGLVEGLLVNAQEVVGREVRLGRNVRDVDGTLVSVPHEVPGVGEILVRLRVHVRARVHRVPPESKTLFGGARTFFASEPAPLPAASWLQNLRRIRLNCRISPRSYNPLHD